MSVEKQVLTNYVGTLAPTKLRAFNIALVVAIGVMAEETGTVPA